LVARLEEKGTTGGLNERRTDLPRKNGVLGTFVEGSKMRGKGQE